VSSHSHASRPAVTEQLLHLRGPLTVRRSTERKTVSKQALPIIPVPICVAEAFVEIVPCSILSMREMRVSPEPGCNRPIFIRGHGPFRYSLVHRRLRRSQPFKRGTCQLAWIPRVIRHHLRIPHRGRAGSDRTAVNQQQQQEMFQMNFHRDWKDR
jgi:hypothetical protein